MLPLSPLMLADWRLYSVVPILYSLYRPIRAHQHRRRAYVVVVDLFLDPGEFQWLITIFRSQGIPVGERLINVDMIGS